MMGMVVRSPRPDEATSSDRRLASPARLLDAWSDNGTAEALGIAPGGNRRPGPHAPAPSASATPPYLSDILSDSRLEERFRRDTRPFSLPRAMGRVSLQAG